MVGLTPVVHVIVERLREKGITILVSTHDVNYAYQWADRILIVEDGRVLAQGSPEKVFRKKELIQQSNLEQFMVLEIYDSLVKAGKLMAQKTPLNLEKLKEFIQQ